MHENRETSETPAVKPGSRTVGEGDSRTAHANVPEESHDGTVPVNHSNKDERPLAENEEGRPSIKENAGQPHTYPTQSGNIQAESGEHEGGRQTRRARQLGALRWAGTLR